MEKQKILRTVKIINPIEKQPMNEIITVLNIIGHKFGNGDRILRRNIPNFFQGPMQEVIKSALNPEKHPQYAMSLKRFCKVREASGPRGIFRLITPIPALPPVRSLNPDNPNAPDNIVPVHNLHRVV